MQSSQSSVRSQAICRFNELAERAGSSVLPAASEFQFQRKRVFYAPNAGVAEIANAIVLSGEWFVLFNDLALCDAYTQTPFPPLSAYHMGLVPPDLLDLIYPRPVRLAVPRAFLLGGCANYSHWLMDYLPRLSLWQRNVPLLANGGMRSFQIESLQAMGIDVDKIVQLDYPNAYQLPSLVFPSLQSYWGAVPPLPFRPDIIQWLRNQFGSLFEAGPARRRIFITRAGEHAVSGRRLLNNEEVVEVAKRFDFEIVACENMSFVDQVKLFSQASVIAGPHGAGFVNVIFSPADARLIELIGPRGSDPATERAGYRQLAGYMNLGFSRVVGQSDESLPIENNHVVNELFSVDLKEFAAVLDRL